MATADIVRIFTYNKEIKIKVMSVIDTWNKDQFLQVMSDAHKYAYGFRPNGVNYSEWTIEELKTEFIELNKIAQDNDEWEATHHDNF